MKILFIAPKHNNLYLDLIHEMENQGHNVLWIPEGWDGKDGSLEYRFTFNGDWKWKFRLGLRRVLNYISRPRIHRWIEREQQIDAFYDVLFCINGLSIHPYIIRKLESNNPNIRKILYLQDNQRFMDYRSNSKYFDKVYTYDLLDAINYSWKFLPYYWLPFEFKGNIVKYDVSCVGIDHSGRGEIVKSVREQLKQNNCNYLFRIYKYANEPILDEIYTHDITSTADVATITQESNCILDTDRESQVATTPRLIWAIAQGKKVITTNHNVQYMPFYNPRQIHLIDRHNPLIDAEWVKLKEIFPIPECINELRIDKWIGNVLG